ncbi:hypothetical protein AOLI_G00311660 [Acnodon oligacanthus]
MRPRAADTSVTNHNLFVRPKPDKARAAHTRRIAFSFFQLETLPSSGLELLSLLTAFMNSLTTRHLTSAL